MATLTPTLTLTSADVLPDTLSMSVTDSLTVNGDVVVQTVLTAAASSGVSIIGTSYAKSYVFVKNVSDVVINLGSDASAALNWIELAVDEFAFFPWDGTDELFAVAASGTNKALEIMIFESANE